MLPRQWPSTRPRLRLLARTQSACVNCDWPKKPKKPSKPRKRPIKLLPEDVVQRLRTKHRERLRHFERGPEEENRRDLTAPPDEIELLLIAAERERINELYRQGTLKDEARRRLERELDLREANLASHQHEE